ncbi:MAG: hypothetical protein M1828_000121 [Chrysothrix sp. TS-e1954]|nr:MAG: hypothetical protein M1828_000121 [Chrysothrix sp. TS-e1954]
MSETQNTLIIEGTFSELTLEIADYIDNLRKAQSESSASVREEVAPLLDALGKAEESNDTDDIETVRDEVLKPIVDASTVLNSAPEREYLAAYNLLIHLIHQSPNVHTYLQPICRTLATADISTSTSQANRFALALSVLSTIFNVLQPDDSVRYPIFSAILDVIAKSGSFENLKPQLRSLDGWLSSWQAGPAQQRKLYLRISRIARDANEADESYEYLIRALRTIPTSDVSGDEARTMSVDALKTALNSPTHFDFEDLTNLDSVQGLRTSEPVYFQLLEIFTSDTLDDYNSFKDEHSGWVEKQDLNDAELVRKIRLLTLASLAASTGQTRTLAYKAISDALQIPSEDVEMWVIDVIRAGLVEGKLSQLNQTFLIHRSTYRVFSENQWREVSGRLDLWKSSLTGVLEVIRAEKENIIAQREQELRQMDSKVNGFSSGGYRRNRNEAIDVGMD